MDGIERPGRGLRLLVGELSKEWEAPPKLPGGNSDVGLRFRPIGDPIPIREKITGKKLHTK